MVNDACLLYRILQQHECGKHTYVFVNCYIPEFGSASKM